MSALRGLVLVLWGSVNWARRRLPFGHARLGVRTISVGNLQAGGAGKTPLVIEIAREALSRGRVVCVLSRGYGGGLADEKILRPGESADPRVVGDEPALLREHLPGIWLAVGRNRKRSFGRAAALSRAVGKPIDFVILDDGFQHHAIRADLHVLAVTSASWRERWFRDFPSEARRAGLVIWTKGDRQPEAAHARVRWVSEVLESGPFQLVTGVADPDEVVSSLAAANVYFTQHTRFRDHHAYRREECQKLLSGARPLLTEKDAVKWRALGFTEGAQFAVIRRRLEWVTGQDAWEAKLWKS